MYYYQFKPQYLLNMKLTLALMPFGLLLLLTARWTAPEIAHDLLYMLTIFFVTLGAGWMASFMVREIAFYNDYCEIRYFFPIKKRILYADILDIDISLIKTTKGTIKLLRMENADKLFTLLRKILETKEIAIDHTQMVQEAEELYVNVIAIPFSAIFSVLISIILFIVLDLTLLALPRIIAVLAIFLISYAGSNVVVRFMYRLRFQNANEK